MQVQRRGVKRIVTGHSGRGSLMCDLVGSEIIPALNGPVSLEGLEYHSGAVSE